MAGIPVTDLWDGGTPTPMPPLLAAPTPAAGGLDPETLAQILASNPYAMPGRRPAPPPPGASLFGLGGGNGFEANAWQRVVSGGASPGTGGQPPQTGGGSPTAGQAPPLTRTEKTPSPPPASMPPMAFPLPATPAPAAGTWGVGPLSPSVSQPSSAAPSAFAPPAAPTVPASASTGPSTGMPGQRLSFGKTPMGSPERMRRFQPLIGGGGDAAIS